MKVIRKLSMTYRPESNCVEEDCDFVTLPSSFTRETAKRHVKNTGHQVRVTTETVDLYGPDV